QPLNTVGRQAFANCLDDRNTTGHSGFEGHHDATLVSSGKNLVAMLGQQRLVGGDHVLALGNGFHDPLACQGVATHQLDHNIDLGVAHHIHAVCGQGDLVPHQRACLFQVTHSNSDHLNTATGAASDFICIAFQYVPGAAANHTQTQQTYFDRTH